MSNWEIKKLGEITTWLSGGTPKKDEPAYWNGDIPWISANSMGGTRYYTSDLKITAEGLENGSRLAPKDSLLLLVRGGALHTKIPIGIARRPLAFNQDVKAIVAKPELIDPWFLLVWFMAKRDYLLANIVEYTGIGAGKLDTVRLQNLEVNLPPITEQRALAHIVNCLEDKIELNQRMNYTLEDIAQAVFTSWFVNFDPVQAKLIGRRPSGMDEETTLLFPDSFEDSAMGKVPKGWKAGRVSDVTEVTDFVANGSFESLRNNVKYTSHPDYAVLVRLADFNHGWKGNYVYLSEAAYTFLKKSSLEPDDVVIANVGANAGTVFKVPNLGKPMTLGPNAVVVKPNEAAGMSKQYLYYLFSGSRGQQQLQSILSGSAQPKFNKTEMRALKIVIPSHEVLTQFKQLTKGLWERQRIIHTETGTLTKIRDTLLPRLISGKLRVCEISETVEAVVS